MRRQTPFQGFESKNFKLAYGGELLKTRKGRERGRPLDTKNTLHLMLRSSKATGDWSFIKSKNAHSVRTLSKKFAHKYGVKILSLANVGNHLHYQIKISNRYAYPSFIRALTGAIAIAVTGKTRWSKSGPKLKFWDYRPFTRVVVGYRAFLNLRDYIEVNALEGFGYTRRQARFLVGWDRARWENTG